MPGIIEFPTVVKQAMAEFGAVFANEPQRVHFAEYLTGLLVAERKTVNGISREFVETTDQSCLNRWLTEVDWDVQALNQKRLAWLQQRPETRYARTGVIPIDNVLIGHDGQLIDDVGWLWDHAEQRHVVAHDYLIANYVCPSGKHYALEFRRFRKREDCAAWHELLTRRPGGIPAADPEEQALTVFKDHTQLCCELVDWVVKGQIPGDFTFDSYFTNATVMNHIHAHGRAYVGDLKFNRKLWVAGREIKASEFAAQITLAQRKPLEREGTIQWYFTQSIRIPPVDHAVRIVILWADQTAAQPAKILVTHRTFWDVTRVVRVYAKRWTGTETHHRDGKQHLGMGECQLRKREGQTRHMYLVLLLHSLLMAQLHHSRACAWAQTTLTTIGEACRAALRETLGATIDWVIDRTLHDAWAPDRIKAHLALL